VINTLVPSAAAAAGPATSRGGFREAPLWGQPPSDASATRVAEDNSFSIIAHSGKSRLRASSREAHPEGAEPLPAMPALAG